MHTEITRTTDTENGLEFTRWTLAIDGEEIGFLAAHASGLILNVEVDTAHQGEGHARRLYEHADREHGLLHVPAWGRSGEGDGFAEAVGGDTMDDERAATILGVDLDVVTGAIYE